MKFCGTLIAVREMEPSRRFYCELLGMSVTADFGANVILSDSIFLQTLDSWQGFVQKDGGEIVLGHNASELYFEEKDMDGFLQKLAVWPGIVYVHLPKEHAWGQRVVRFYDPDRHIIEVGENITMVVNRFLNSGMTPEETARRMDVPEAYIRQCMKAAGEYGNL